MRTGTLPLLQHDLNFPIINRKGKQRTQLVLVTLMTMILEMVGMLFGSTLLWTSWLR